MTDGKGGKAIRIIPFVNSRVKSLWPYIAIIAAVFYVYFRTLFFGFVWLDDNVLILDNQWFLHSLAHAGQSFTREIFNTHGPASYYRPLLTLSLILDAQFGGTAPFMYHVTNMLLHMAASCLVFAFLTTFGVKRHVAFALTLVFCVHPVLAQAVAWIPGRNDSLLALFALPAMIALMRYWQSGNMRYLLGHGLFFTLALFTKESMALFPFVGTVWILLYVVSSDSGQSRSTAVRALLENGSRITSLFITWLLPGILWAVLRKIALANPIHYTAGEAIKSLFKNAPALLLYLGKTVLPFNLEALPTLQDSSQAYGYIALGAGAMLIAAAFTRYIRTNDKGSSSGNRLSPASAVFFGLLWFLLFLVPSLVQPDASSDALFFEHRIYVPLVGLLLVAAQARFVRELDLRRVSAWIALGCCVYFFSVITRQHVGIFSDRIVFYETAVKYAPRHPFGHKNLGAIYQLEGKIDLAEKEDLATLQLNPYEAMIHNNLGLIYQLKGDTLKARQEFDKELAINPNYALAHFNLGRLRYTCGQKKDAEKLWLKTLELEPDYIDAMKYLCVYYHEISDTTHERRFSMELINRGIPWTADSAAKSAVK
ncbi:MAG: hypothetical protein ABSF80_09670 [Chitinispirillaceae bacterium]